MLRRPAIPIISSHRQTTLSKLIGTCRMLSPSQIFLCGENWSQSLFIGRQFFYGFELLLGGLQPIRIEFSDLRNCFEIDLKRLHVIGRDNQDFLKRKSCRGFVWNYKIGQKGLQEIFDIGRDGAIVKMLAFLIPSIESNTTQRFIAQGIFQTSGF